jgi:hypothetical protein
VAPVAAKRLPRKLRPELMVNARELENIVFVCRCECRIEVSPDGGIEDDATCPQCGGSLDAERRAFELYSAAYNALAAVPLLVYFRIAPRGKLRVRPREG